MTHFVADEDFVGGTNVTVAQVVPAAVNSPDEMFLRTVKVGASGLIAVRPVRREIVRVTFVDVSSNAAGQCLQGLSIGGQPYVVALDVFAATGPNSAVVRDVVVDQTGTCTLSFPVVAGQSQIAAVEFLDGTGLPLSVPVTPQIAIPTDGVKWRRSIWPTADFTGTPLFVEIIAGPNIDYDLVSSPPAPGLPAVGWSERFERVRNISAGDQISYLRAVDDGGRVFIDGVKIQAKLAGTSTNAESWVQQAPADYDFPFHVAATHNVAEVVEHNNTFATSSIHYSSAAAAAPPPTPPPPPSGTVLVGSFQGSAFSSLQLIPQWDQLVGRATTIVHTFIDTHDTVGIQNCVDYVAAHPGLYLKLALNVLIGEAGNFGSTAERARCVAIAHQIQNAGVASRVVIRHMYEMNADYGFEWMPASHGGQFAAAKTLYDDILTQMKAVAPGLTFYQNMVPWNDYAGHSAPEMDLVYVSSCDKLSFDVYGSDVSGTPDQRWSGPTLNGFGGVEERAVNGITYARSKGKGWAWDEFANRATFDAQGNGDDKVYAHGMWSLARTSGDCHSATWYQSGAGGVDLVLGPQSPQALQATIEELALF